eukprot:439135-Amphidinium_carterae.1
MSAPTAKIDTGIVFGQYTLTPHALCGALKHLGHTSQWFLVREAEAAAVHLLPQLVPCSRRMPGLKS